MDYLLGTPLSEISREIMEFVLEHQMPEVSTAEMPYYEKIKDKLRIRLVGLEGNRVYLEEGIYRPHLMGAEVVYLELARNPEGDFAVRVTSDLLERWGVPEKEVFNRAKKFLGKIGTPVLFNGSGGCPDPGYGEPRKKNS